MIHCQRFVVAKIAIDKPVHETISEDIEILRRLGRVKFLGTAVVRPVFNLTGRSKIIGDRDHEIRLARVAGILTREAWLCDPSEMADMCQG